MDSRLPKKLEDCLIKFSRFNEKPYALIDYFESVPFDQAWNERLMLEALEEEQFLKLISEEVFLEGPSDAEPRRDFAYRPTLLLTAKAKCYLEDLPKTKVVRALKIIGSVLASIGGMAATINLLLYVLWH